MSRSIAYSDGQGPRYPSPPFQISSRIEQCSARTRACVLGARTRRSKCNHVCKQACQISDLQMALALLSPFACTHTHSHTLTLFLLFCFIWGQGGEHVGSPSFLPRATETEESVKVHRVGETGEKRQCKGGKPNYRVVTRRRPSEHRTHVCMCPAPNCQTAMRATIVIHTYLPGPARQGLVSCVICR